jgi:hypothetical protein
MAIRIIAKTKKNQSNLNKAIEWGLKHNAANDMRNRADDNGDLKAYKAANKLCENTFEKYLDYLSELPKSEQKRVEKITF